MKMKRIYYYATPIGQLGVAEQDGAITDLLFEGQTLPDTMEEQTPLLARAGGQLTEYFAGTRKTFDLPLAPQGTAFQRAVWSALIDIPYGETRSYRQIAEAVGNPKACRAVGMANNRNPISIFIPCHRVIGANGSLTGYGGGLPLKEQLLRLEQTKATR